MVPRQGQIELTGCTKAMSPGNDPELGARPLEGLECDPSLLRAPLDLGGRDLTL
jgi:hypothetical protein